MDPGLSGHVQAHLQRGHSFDRAPQRDRGADDEGGHAGLVPDRVPERLVEEARHLGGQDDPGAVDHALQLRR